MTKLDETNVKFECVRLAIQTSPIDYNIEVILSSAQKIFDFVTEKK